MTERLRQLTPAQLRSLLSHDVRTAAVWLLAAAYEDMPEAQISYGRMLLDGRGIAQDQVAALYWFRRAAAAGDLDAINMVGRCVENGWGTPADAKAATLWFQRAADGGHAWARYNLAHCYLGGCGVPRDVDHAFKLYCRAAAQKHERAMNLLGRCYEEGLGTPKNFATAAIWYRRSAEGGYFRGQYNWATLLLETGRIDEAANWFEQAALGGTPAVRQAVQTVAQSSPHIELRSLAQRLKESAFCKTGAASRKFAVAL